MRNVNRFSLMTFGLFLFLGARVSLWLREPNANVSLEEPLDSLGECK